FGGGVQGTLFLFGFEARASYTYGRMLNQFWTRKNDPSNTRLTLSLRASISPWRQQRITECWVPGKEGWSGWVTEEIPREDEPAPKSVKPDRALTMCGESPTFHGFDILVRNLGDRHATEGCARMIQWTEHQSADASTRS